MKYKTARKAWAFPPVLSLLIAFCWHLEVARAACLTATEVTPKLMAASVTTLNVPYRYKNPAVYDGYRYYINDITTGSWADFYDISNTADCSFVSCETYLHGSTASATVSNSVSSSYGDVTNTGIAYIDTDSYSTTVFTNKVLKLRCLFNDEYKYVVSSVMTTSLICVCNQYTVTLTKHSS